MPGLTLLLGLLGDRMAGPVSPYHHQDDMPTFPKRPSVAGIHGLGWARALSLGVSCAALIGILLSGSLLFDAWYARWTWVRSEEYRQTERLLAMSVPDRADPILQERAALTEYEGEPTREVAAGADASARGTGRVVTPNSPALRSTDAPAERASAVPQSPDEGMPVPQAPAGPSLEVSGTEFRFLDVPAAGAHATLTVTLANRTDALTAPVVLSIPAGWFDGYDIIGAVPAVFDDRVEDDGYRSFDFPGVPPGTDTTLELHVTAANGDVAAPAVRLALRDGGSLGELHPTTVAPRPPPGPVRALHVPRLGINTGVVDTGWEPPSFVAGQISTTAALGEGNSVIVGHRRGHAGDVFARLVSARLGDIIVAASREGEHRYVVSEIRTLTGDDITPIGPAETPRLTLMTCVGGWNMLTGDYSHRLWVVAEPPELARLTLAATIARASQAGATPASPSDALKARTDAVSARAALAVMDAELRRKR
jgi:LPXTG-site transpeptidase (sortase) family protein